jgi:hypothetical protein
MPTFDVELELPRDAAVAREDRDAVAVRVVVHELERLVVGRHAHDRRARAEDLVAVGVHLGRHVVEQRDAEEEAVRVRARLAAVGDERRALGGPDSRYDGDLVADARA